MERFLAKDDKNDMGSMARLWMVLTVVMTFNNILVPICVAFVGHTGTEELAAITLAMAVVNLLVDGLFRGYVTGSDSFVAQAFGNGQTHMLGVLLQRSVITQMLGVCILSPLYINMESILLSLGQPPLISKIVGDFILWYIPGIYLLQLWLILSKYLAILDYVVLSCLITASGLLVCTLSMYILIVQLQCGTWTTAIALSLNWLVMDVFAIVAMYYIGFKDKYWLGMTWTALEDVWLFMRHSCNAMVVFLTYWCLFEVMVIIAGRLGTTSLAVTGVFYNVYVLVSPIAIGLCNAVSIQIGQILGHGEATRASKQVKIVHLLTLVHISAVIGCLFGLRKILPQIYTDSEEVASAVSQMTPVMAFLYFGESLAFIGRGVTRGCGKLMVPMIASVIFYGFIGLPLMTCVSFGTSLGLTAGWISFACCSVACSVFYLIYLIAFTDWNALSEEACKGGGAPNIGNEDAIRESETTGLIRSEHNLTTTNSDSGVICDDEWFQNSYNKRQLVVRAVVIMAVAALCITAGVMCRCLVVVNVPFINNTTSELLNATRDPTFTMIAH